MKLLVFSWHSFMNKGIERALNKSDIKHDTYFYQFTDWEKDDKFLEKFREHLRNGSYSDVLSVNYSPLISQVCDELGVRYTSWVYDSPLHIRNLDSLKNSCNCIYFFDRGQAEEYRKLGIDALHMPLAVDTDVFALDVPADSRDGYKSDISMVGQLYQTEYEYFTAPLDGYDKGYLEGIIKAQQKVNGGYLIPELVTDELLSRMNATYAKVATDGFQMGRRELEYMLACETTGRDRFTALALLSQHYNVNLYTGNVDKRLEKVKFCGYADYYTQMPLVFAESRVNLNISLKTIRTGIPLRVLDVQGCGGFLISNCQEEIFEHFNVGEEIVLYESIEDLYMKTKYYLEHEDERKRVAQAGYERVKKDFTFEARIREMF